MRTLLAHPRNRRLPRGPSSFLSPCRSKSYFIRRIEKHLHAKGRRLIGWSEILQGGLAPNAAVMDWIGGAREATQSGHDAVMSPTSHCYFDYSYDAISVEGAYSFNHVNALSVERVLRPDFPRRQCLHFRQGLRQSPRRLAGS